MPQESRIRVLHHTLNYPPDGNSTADLQGELGADLAEVGMDVVALSATPNANRDPEAEARQPLVSRLLGLYQTSRHNGVDVFHVAIPKKGSRIFSRAFDYGRFFIVSVLLGCFAIRRSRVILAVSPPLTIGLSAWAIAALTRARFVYVVQEIYPDIAVYLGVLRNARLILLFEALERFVYRGATRVVVICEPFRDQLMHKGVSPSKIEVIPNFVDLDLITSKPKENSIFAEANELQSKFVVLYAGNIGLSQSMETIVEAAQSLSSREDIHFLIVGGGSRYTWLEAEVARRRLSNLKLLPYQPRSSVPEIYRACDLGLVPLKRGTALATFPSKVYTLMAAGRPVIASAETETELAQVVGRSRCGWVVPPENPNALVAAVTSAEADRGALTQMGANGRGYVEAHHARNLITEQYASMLKSVLE